ncbi:MAG: hypothetical protein ACD_71C00050G0003 [uncultured bacterium (gcode 4)]|uniref:FecR protein domain-containing protein n=1 Tax=uncultured bacterium (gcode 4) TaxID=1234023 RepID=K2A3Q7_9BACT|nr:MAG: hypothetical protein ACD_71C00050G0003 [uncultured bacterium (gcode 4)]
MQNFSKTPEWFFLKHAIALIMWGLFAIIGLLLYSDFSENPTIISEKIDPYVLSTKGKTLIIRDKLITVEENKQAPVFVWDKIKTLDSTATVFWPDGSITRLWEKSSIRIHEMRAKTANEDIQVEFSLEEGKSWSNVIKYLYGESYFHERFNNDTALAAVRGTIFEVNLDRKYIHTIDHSVSIEDLKSHTGSILIVAGGIFDTDTRKRRIQSEIDAIWNKANSDADIIYLNERMESLKKEILGRLGKENYLETFLQKIGLQKSQSSLEALITGDENGWIQFENEMRSGGNSGKLMDIYQSIYGLQNSKEIINTKMKLRNLIIETAPADEKKVFLDDFAQSTLYDSWNALKIGSGSIEWLEEKLEEYVKQGADKDLINALKNAARQESIQELNDTLESTKQTIIKTLGEKNLLEEAKKEIHMEDWEKINDEATDIRNSVIDGLKNLTQ